MKCPTCGKTVNKDQPVCAFCGAMTGGPAAIPSATQSGEFHPPSFEQKKPPRVGEPGPEAQDRPVLETPEGAEEFPELAPDAPQESESPQPKPPAWVRFVSPLFFVVLFLVTQFWLRDSDRSSPPGSEQTAESGPTLRQGTFAAEIPDGRAAETRTVFSLRDDRQIVFVSSWRGSPRGHSYEVEWHSPDGAAHPSSNVVASTAPGGEGFSVIATLEMTPALPLGEWRVEVSQDEEIVSRFAFRLNE